MSTINRDGIKVVLEGDRQSEFWDIIERDYVRGDPLKWKYLAALVLREEAGWTLERIALVLDRDEGHISRALQQIQFDLRKEFRTSPDWEPDDPQRSPES